MLDGDCSTVGAPRIVLERYEDGALQVETRVISLKDPVKIGRAVGRHKPAADNGVFECRVLSRNQAIIWHEDNRFFIKDTKSSNGTFVNNQRLAPEESYQIFSEDVLQFGIDVTEGGVRSHSCVITQITIHNADGTEVPKRPPQECRRNLSAIYPMDVQLLLEESCRRQVNLRQKIYAIDEQIDAMLENVNMRFEEAIDRDDLIYRIGVLEKQLSVLRSARDADEMEEQLMRLTDSISRQSSKHRVQLLRAEEENNMLKREMRTLQARLYDLEERLSSRQNVLNNSDYSDEKAAELAAATAEQNLAFGISTLALNGNAAAIPTRLDVGTQYETVFPVSQRLPDTYVEERDYAFYANGHGIDSSSDEGDDDRVSIDTVVARSPPIRTKQCCNRSVSPILGVSATVEVGVAPHTQDQGTITEQEVFEQSGQENGHYIVYLSGCLGLLSFLVLLAAIIVIWSPKFTRTPAALPTYQTFRHVDL